MILILIEIVGVTLFIAGWISQIVLPIMRGTPLFPLFKRESKLRREMLTVEQLLVEQQLTAELQTKQSQVNNQPKEKECV